VKNDVYVSVSTDPIESYEGIIEYAKELQFDADFLHCDVMDGKFVEKVNYDYALVKNINANAIIPLDVHLMVEEPMKDLPNYVKAGANIITLHYEAFANKEELVEAINYIKANNCLAGLSLNPDTQFKEIKPYCYNIDLLLVMSVVPGMSGQKFIPNTIKKIKEINAFREENNLDFKIEVDGGVNPDNAKKLIECGVDILVSGSFIYKAQNRREAIEQLKN